MLFGILFSSGKPAVDGTFNDYSVKIKLYRSHIYHCRMQVRGLKCLSFTVYAFVFNTYNK